VVQIAQTMKIAGAIASRLKEIPMIAA